VNTNHYTYRVTWSAEDGEYVGLCTEFPSLSWLADTPGEAFSGITQVVADVIKDMLANDEIPPEPMADRTFSGKFMVRIPPETHRALAIRATEDGISLNRLIAARLASDALK
jgi:predicted HicB family RNase H-like nuclease